MPSVVLALTAHPDDAEFFAGGTLAGLIAAGARAHILVATDGSSRFVRARQPGLAALRAEAAAALALGAEPPILLGYPDLEPIACRPAFCARPSSGPFAACGRMPSSPRTLSHPTIRIRIIEPSPGRRRMRWPSHTSR
jgi:LmbE family N-acetylglucosaminyl deacetylase